MSMKPWEVNPELTQERLCFVANEMKKILEKVLGLHDPDEGDSTWGLGCRIYDRTINILERKATGIRWLNIFRDRQYFVIIIDGVCLRFYKGKFNAPTTRTLHLKYPEISQNREQFSFEFEPQKKWIWRISVEPDDDGRVFRIMIAQYDPSKKSNNYRNEWEIPLDNSVSVIASVKAPRQDAVELNKPAVYRKQKISEKVKNVRAK